MRKTKFKVFISRLSELVKINGLYFQGIESFVKDEHASEVRDLNTLEVKNKDEHETAKHF